jgi:pimeloyl-ACP methyl ester carboxylesterase
MGEVAVATDTRNASPPAAAAGEETGPGAPPEGIGALPPPSKLLLLLEGRAAGELVTTLMLWPFMDRLPRGDGHAVLVLPGFLASDLSTRPLRGFLRHLGYRPHRWHLGRNLGAHEQLDGLLAERLQEVHARHGGRPVSLIGWSLGGLYARALANRFTSLVRCVVTLGSPFSADAKANNGWRLYEWLTDQRIDEIPRQRIDLFRSTPPVPTTSIFSRSDGIVAWRSAVQAEGVLAESVRVPGSHLGLGFNPLALYVIADRLAQPEGHWQPFFRPGHGHPPGVHAVTAEARRGLTLASGPMAAP